jgi:hypothetical protein
MSLARSFCVQLDLKLTEHFAVAGIFSHQIKHILRFHHLECEIPVTYFIHCVRCLNTNCSFDMEQRTLFIQHNHSTK